MAHKDADARRHDSTTPDLFDIENRRGTFGRTVSVELLTRIVHCKLAHPAASQDLIAEMCGTTQVTVSAALTSGYGRQALAHLADEAEVLRSQLLDGARDSITYSRRAVQKGVKELDAERPREALLRTATASATLLLKGTILPDRVRLETHYQDAGSFGELESNEATALLAEYRKAVQTNRSDTEAAVADESSKQRRVSIQNAKE